MLQPKRTKFRKAHKGRIHGQAKRGFGLNFGAFGLKATTPGRITARQIEAARRAITRHMKRSGRVWRSREVVGGERFRFNASGIWGMYPHCAATNRARFTGRPSRELGPR